MLHLHPAWYTRLHIPHTHVGHTCAHSRPLCMHTHSLWTHTTRHPSHTPHVHTHCPTREHTAGRLLSYTMLAHTPCTPVPHPWGHKPRPQDLPSQVPRRPPWLSWGGRGQEGDRGSPAWPCPYSQPKVTPSTPTHIHETVWPDHRQGCPCVCTHTHKHTHPCLHFCQGHTLSSPQPPSSFETWLIPRGNTGTETHQHL